MLNPEVCNLNHSTDLKILLRCFTSNKSNSTVIKPVLWGSSCLWIGILCAMNESKGQLLILDAGASRDLPSAPHFLSNSSPQQNDNFLYTYLFWCYFSYFVVVSADTFSQPKPLIDFSLFLGQQELKVCCNIAEIAADTSLSSPCNFCLLQLSLVLVTKNHKGHSIPILFLIFSLNLKLQSSR